MPEDFTPAEAGAIVHFANRIAKGATATLAARWFTQGLAAKDGATNPYNIPTSLAHRQWARGYAMRNERPHGTAARNARES